MPYIRRPTCSSGAKPFRNPCIENTDAIDLNGLRFEKSTVLILPVAEGVPRKNSLERRPGIPELLSASIAIAIWARIDARNGWSAGYVNTYLRICLVYV